MRRRDDRLEGLLAAAGKAVEKRKAAEWANEDKRYELLQVAAAKSDHDVDFLFSRHGEQYKVGAFKLAVRKNNIELARAIWVILKPEDKVAALLELSDEVFFAIALAQYTKNSFDFSRVFLLYGAKVFLSAIRVNHYDLAVAAFQLISSEKRVAIFSELNLEQSTAVFNFLNRLRKDNQGSRLDQAHLNEQMAKVADCLENKALAAAIRKNGGFCFAWSSSEASLSILGHEDFWDAAKLLLAMWTGDRESLSQAVFLPGKAEPARLQDLLAWVVNSEVKTQRVRLGEAALLPVDATLFAPQEAHAAEPQELFVQRDASFFAVPDRRVQGEFSLEQLREVLSKIALDALEKDGYVAICTGLHAVHFQICVDSDGRKIYRVFDSNQPYGRQSFDRLSLAAHEILSRQGPVLELTSVKVLRSEGVFSAQGQQDAAKSLYPEGSFHVTSSQFFSLFLTAKSAELPKILAANHITDPDIWNQPFKLYQATPLAPDRIVSAPLLFFAVYYQRVDLVEMLLEQGAKPSIISTALKVEGKLSLQFFEGLDQTFHLCFNALKTQEQKQLALCGLVDLAQKGEGDFHWLIVTGLISRYLEQAGFTAFSQSLFPKYDGSYRVGDDQKALYRRALLDWQKVAKPKPKSSIKKPEQAPTNTTKIVARR